MDKIKSIFATLFFTLVSIQSFSQNPDYVDPGNVRGDEGTVYLWENPTFYIPVLVVVIFVVALALIRKKRSS